MFAVVSLLCSCGHGGQGHTKQLRIITIGTDTYELRSLEQSVPVDISRVKLYTCSTQRGELHAFPREEAKEIARCLGQIRGARIEVETVTLAYVFGNPLAAEVSGQLCNRLGIWELCVVRLRKETNGDWSIDSANTAVR
jgi:hypothetical protein